MVDIDDLQNRMSQLIDSAFVPIHENVEDICLDALGYGSHTSKQFERQNMSAERKVDLKVTLPETDSHRETERVVGTAYFDRLGGIEIVILPKGIPYLREALNPEKLLAEWALRQ